MNNETVLEVKNLQTKFKVGKRTVHAVNDVSFELKRGITLGVVGESGCGKSVTAHSIAQLLPKAGYISNGIVRYIDREDKDHILNDFKRKGKKIRSVRGQDIAMVFQDPMSSLDPVYSIGQQISENLMEHENISRQQAKQRVIELLSQLGIPEAESRYDDYPHQFSGGMKQRVMIAIAMICNPNILIADEPTTALDVTIQAQILSLMKDIQKNYDTSIMLITHNMGIVAETCDEVAVMYMGRIAEYGTLQQVLGSSKHPYTKALLKSVPVLGLGGKEKLEPIRGTTPDASETIEGCAFAPRCDFCMDICYKRLPEQTALKGNHKVSCWLYAQGDNHGA